MKKIVCIKHAAPSREKNLCGNIKTCSELQDKGKLYIQEMLKDFNREKAREGELRYPTVRNNYLNLWAPQYPYTCAQQTMNERKSEDFAAEAAGRSNSTATPPERCFEDKEAGGSGTAYDRSLCHNPVLGT